MQSFWQNRAGLALAALALASIGEGAVRVSAKLPVSMLHRGMGAAALVLSLALAAGLWRRRAFLAKSLLTLAALASLAGGMAEMPALRASCGVLHAVVSHLMFAAGFVAWHETRRSMREGAKVEDAGWPSLRALAVSTPVVIVAQIALGALYRHQLAGVVPHVTGAFVASVLVLMAGAAVFTLQDVTPGMKKWAGLTLGLLIAQVLLGVAAYFARVTDSGQLVAMTVAHVVTGALLLGVQCVLSTLIFKQVVTVPRTIAAGELAGSGRNG